jgi:hypothetical protein
VLLQYRNELLASEQGLFADPEVSVLSLERVYPAGIQQVLECQAAAV